MQLRTFTRDRRGATVAEYIVLLMVIFFIAVVTYKVLGSFVSTKVGIATNAATGGGGGGGGGGGAGTGGAGAGAGANGTGNTTAGGARAAGGTGATASQGDGTQAGGGGGAGGGGHAGGDGYSTFDENGRRIDTQASKGSSLNLSRIVLLVFGIAGAAAAFFGIMKGKHAS